jgi:tetratricopeptide (TPR) repeat protein
MPISPFQILQFGKLWRLTQTMLMRTTTSAMQIGHPDEAVAQFKMALEITPDKISTLKNLAIAYVRMGKLTDAIPLVEKALALAKSSGDESMVKEITVNLEQLIKMSRSVPQGSR